MPDHNLLCRQACRLFSAALALVAGCATVGLTSTWSHDHFAADGAASEWTDASSGVLKNGLHLTVRNDARRLYVLARFRRNDERWARAAAVGGMTVRVTGRGRKAVGFRLVAGPEPQGPFRRDADSAVAPRGRAYAGGPPGRDAGLVGKVVVISPDGTEMPLPADGTHGPAAGYACADGMCTYEFAIPLQDAGAQGHFGIAAAPGSSIKVSASAGPSAAERQALRDRMPSGPGDGPPSGGFGGGDDGFGPPGGGGRGFGPPGGGMGRGPGGSQTETNPELSVTVRLASVP